MGAAIDQLLRQLSRSTVSPNEAQLTETEIVSSECCRLLVARDNGKNLVTLSLVLFRTPTGLLARIEDVVVDEIARRKGVGQALNRQAMRI